MPELDATFRDLVERLAHIQARKNELQDEEDQIKAKLAENLDEGTYTLAGRPALTVTTGRRFDAKLAAEVLPAELLALCQVTAVDLRRAKEVLSPAVYAKCQRENARKTVTVK